MNRASAKAVGLGKAKSMTKIERVGIYVPYIQMYTTANLPVRLRLKAKLWQRYCHTRWKVKEWFLGHYRRHAYRHVQRLLHKFNLHYMPARDPITGDNPHERHHWCQWCGLRGTTYGANPGPINNDPV